MAGMEQDDIIFSEKADGYRAETHKWFSSHVSRESVTPAALAESHSLHFLTLSTSLV